MIAGQIQPEIASCRADCLNRPDVVCLGHVADVGAVYRSADVFAFPSLEEAGPLVSYEAMACGLPMLVSPMGAGAVVRHQQDGYVLDPYHGQEWIDALRRLAADADLRRQFGEAAARRAEQFTWDRVGRARRELLLETFAPEPSAKPAWACSGPRAAASPRHGSNGVSVVPEGHPTPAPQPAAGSAGKCRDQRADF